MEQAKMANVVLNEVLQDFMAERKLTRLSAASLEKSIINEVEIDLDSKYDYDRLIFKVLMGKASTVDLVIENADENNFKYRLTLVNDGHKDNDVLYLENFFDGKNYDIYKAYVKSLDSYDKKRLVSDYFKSIDELQWALVMTEFTAKHKEHKVLSQETIVQVADKGYYDMTQNEIELLDDLFNFICKHNVTLLHSVIDDYTLERFFYDNLYDYNSYAFDIFWMEGLTDDNGKEIDSYKARKKYWNGRKSAIFGNLATAASETLHIHLEEIHDDLENHYTLV